MEENDHEDQFNPFDTQNEFFRLATGLKEDVYTHLEVVSQGHTDASKFSVVKNDYGKYSFNCTDSSVKPTLKWNYMAPEDGLYLMYADITDGDDVRVMKNDEPQKRTYGMGRSYIACIGYFNKGDKISVGADLKENSAGSAKVYVNMLNSDVFEKGYAIVSRDVMQTTHLTDSSMEGTINVTQDGLFYTSVPHEKGMDGRRSTARK